jgi:hypothetical protein
MRPDGVRQVRWSGRRIAREEVEVLPFAVPSRNAPRVGCVDILRCRSGEING